MCLFLSLYTCYGISIPGSDYIIFEHHLSFLFFFNDTIMPYRGLGIVIHQHLSTHTVCQRETQVSSGTLLSTSRIQKLVWMLCLCTEDATVTSYFFVWKIRGWAQLRTSLTSSHIHKHRVNEPDMLTSASVTRTVLPYRVSKGSTVNSCAIKKKKQTRNVNG